MKAACVVFYFLSGFSHAVWCSSVASGGNVLLLWEWIKGRKLAIIATIIAWPLITAAILFCYLEHLCGGIRLWLRWKADRRRSTRHPNTQETP